MLNSFARRSLVKTVSRSLTMQAWRIANSVSSPTSDPDIMHYDEGETDFFEKLSLQKCKIPVIGAPGDVLVKVHASSVNPIDLRMYNGYGRKVLDWMFWVGDFAPKVTSDRHPLILGRDFSGEVVSVGGNTIDLSVGDEVFGVVEPHKQGAHAQYVTSPQYCLHKKPGALSHVDAASIPYVALTAWSALCTFGHLSSNNCNGKRVLIIGGSGGIGSFAMQLLKSWGAHVTATCSDNNILWLETNLLVDQVISYDDVVELENLKNSFDFVLDAGRYNPAQETREQIIESSTKYLRPFKGSTYVTISPPILSNTDKYGILIGTAKSGLEALNDTLKGLQNFNSVRWALFSPNKQALAEITRLIEMEIIKPIIQDVYSFNELPKAFKQLESGKTRGKIVIDHTKEENQTTSQ